MQRYEIAGDIRMRIFIVCATISLQAQALPVAAASANKEIELFDKVGGWYPSNNHLTVYNGGSGYLRVEIKNVNYMSGSINWYVETSGDTWDNRFAVPTSPKMVNDNRNLERTALSSGMFPDADLSCLPNN